MNRILNILAIIQILLLPYGYSGITQQRSQANDGLYNDDDKVISLSANNFKDHVVNKNYAILLEFYNSYCGHCRRFAPTYKELASDLWSWRNVLKVMAIDCSNDENNDICRKYEIMAYPTLRYFSPHYKDDNDQNVGTEISGQIIDFIKKQLVKSLVNETISSNEWPDFSVFNSENKNDIINKLPSNVQYVFIIYETEGSTLASNVILHFNNIKSIRIRRITSQKIALNFNIQSFNHLGIINRSLNIDVIPIASVDTEDYQKAIKQYLKKHNISVEDEERDFDNNNKGNNSTNANVSSTTDHDDTIKERNDAILNEVKKNHHIVYHVDLELALRYSLFHEIPSLSIISGEKLLALQRYVNVVKEYNPLGNNGKKFLEKFHEFIFKHNEEIHGEKIQNELMKLENEFSPIFSSSHWVGCLSSKPKLRGFTCGLWQFFHFMTVQSAENEKSTDSLEILQAIHGYVKYFFGCSECSNHFQAMAARRKIWNTSSKDNAILWLWSAHNEVNKRLSGDLTEDPEFPKIQFPSYDSCPKCYKHLHKSSTLSSSSLSSIDNDSYWDRTEVLLFLKRLHNPKNISTFGIDDSSVFVKPIAEKLRDKHLLGNVFSDLDMRMGIFLYIFCIGMMIIAVKLFLRKGYRKKTYSHDFLGKV